MRDTDDNIIAYLLGEAEALSKPQQAKLERLFSCDALIRQYGIRHKVLQMMASKYKHEYGERGYSMRTAIADYESTEYVFGTTTKHNRDYHISLLLAQIEETRQVAKIAKNAMAMARCDQNKAMVLEKFLGDKDTPAYEQVQVPDQIFTADPKALGMAELPDDAKLQAELERLRELPVRMEAIDVGFTDSEEVADA